jgi:diamine N-acetyltransferase
MIMLIIRADTRAQYAIMEGLARRIVPDFYVQFFAAETAGYLVETGHTVEALEAQAGRGSRHFLIDWNGEAVGYFSLSNKGATMLLSHFYLLPEYRGRGLGKMAMEFIEGEARASGAADIELFVLRENKGAVGLYTRSGFVVAAEVLTRLGEGAVLEDYVMRKEIER